MRKAGSYSGLWISSRHQEIRVIVGCEGQIPWHSTQACMDCSHLCACVCVWELFNKLITGLIKKADIYSKAQRSRSWVWCDHDGGKADLLQPCREIDRSAGGENENGKGEVKTTSNQKQYKKINPQRKWHLSFTNMACRYWSGYRTLMKWGIYSADKTQIFADPLGWWFMTHPNRSW